MAHPIVEKILRDGLGSVRLEMLSPEAREPLMRQAGRALLNSNRLAEAAEAFARGNVMDELRVQGEWLREQGRLADAALFLRHVDREDALRRLAEDCIGIGEIEAARAIYETLGDAAMLSFLQENFAAWGPTAPFLNH